MGFRFRKSINFGGGFRINLSKSGIGYSWGTKGYRITKTAKGKTRKTFFIPGTGISYTRESGKKHKRQIGEQQNIPDSISNHYGTEDIVNNKATNIISEGLEDILASARRKLRINKIATIGICFFLFLGFINPLFILLCLSFIVLKIYIKTAGRINLEYIIDEEQKEAVTERMKPVLKVAESEKVWRITQSSNVIDKKLSSGASSSVKRISCITTRKSPFPFKTNSIVVSFKTGNETLIFLPDKLFIVQNSKIGALNYSDISIHTHTTKFVEEEAIPKDAIVVDYTWKYINKSGAPDKRFKNNRKLPICLYGKVTFKSIFGLNTILMFSNISSK